ncbi:TIGR03668 family PPOX class F420-dependent oxidoreductase [Pseudonocardia sp. HH130630-07]|uniref:TIGR03668 family PPOX class F420-dependent oxidoreductase n=1 Tax=Pseudonocardia sp. HH130630-07 TaxID=1690815 RepID=UPI00081535D0|nr:TIGR03668 family PPOX class F420-dependent oxidoreductase [Pseudonocardia sp. HH130630-07]ANY09409.1 F420-dependent protein [Pseudonocardia sp. HH130630-07]
MPTLDPDACRDRLAAAPVARLATLRRDGTPRLVPITFVLVDGLVCSAVDRVKPKSGTRLARLRDVGRDPRVGLLADRYDDDWSHLWWVRLDATAAEHTDGGLRDRAIDALVGKYPPYRADRPDGPVLVLSPQAWSGWSAV